MPRLLTPAESQRIQGKRKAEGSRPTYFDAGTSEFVPISRDFETLTLLLPIAFRARIGQYLTALTVANAGPSTMAELRREWLTARHADLNTVADSYGALVTSYESIRQGFMDAGSGFEDVLEYQRLLADLSKVVGAYVDDYEAAKFHRSVVNVLNTRAAATPGTTSPTLTELQSFVTAMLRYP